MYWIVFLSFASAPSDDVVTLLEVPSFAKGEIFESLDQCQKVLTDTFLNGDFPELQNDERKWQLARSGKLIEGISHSHDKDIVFSYQIRCIENKITE